MRKNHNGAVDQITPDDLGPGAIHKRFTKGAKAVCLRRDPRVQTLWNALVRDVGVDHQFWRQSVFELANNHIAGENNFGDILRFAPGQFGHLARKFGFFRDARTARYRLYPGFETGGEKLLLVSQDVLRIAWDLSLDIQQSITPFRIDPTDYAVTVELLKYSDSGEELQKVFELIGDSCSKWARAGQKVDTARALACGPFDTRFVRDLFGWLSLVPSFGDWLVRRNEKFREIPLHYVGDDEMVVGPPHTDGIRYLTMLAGERQVIKTEVFDGQEWTEIPLEETALTIFPGRASDSHVGIKPTVHRYTTKRSSHEALTDSDNLTLVLGLIPRELISDVARDCGDDHIDLSPNVQRARNARSA